ncbi:MAG: MBL fold metallo-hydrolase [Lachnospiraceae bacterium]|nr:MBL fold metallo-hydrolase [Lachnospiraceae bacterium]
MITRSLPFYEIADGVFEIDEFECASMFVIVGSERALLIDTGVGIGDLRWVLENRITDKPYDVVISHAHGDHFGGAGFFERVFVNEKDLDWNRNPQMTTIEFRRHYAEMIAARGGGKHFDYDPGRDIRPWERTPEKVPIRDGHIFELGGRTVSCFDCPGHTPGEMVFIDDQSRILFCADACNRNLILGSGWNCSREEMLREAADGLQRIIGMRDRYDAVFNGHHDFRGFGQSLFPEALGDALQCMREMLEGTAAWIEVEDQLNPGTMKKVAEHGLIQITSRL